MDSKRSKSRPRASLGALNPWEGFPGYPESVVQVLGNQGSDFHAKWWPEGLGDSWKAPCSFRTCSPAMNLKCVSAWYSMRAFSGYPESRSKSLCTNTRQFHTKWWPEGLGDSWEGGALIWQTQRMPNGELKAGLPYTGCCERFAGEGGRVQDDVLFLEQLEDGRLPSRRCRSSPCAIRNSSFSARSRPAT